MADSYRAIEQETEELCSRKALPERGGFANSLQSLQARQQQVATSDKPYRRSHIKRSVRITIEIIHEQSAHVHEESVGDSVFCKCNLSVRMSESMHSLTFVTVDDSDAITTLPCISCSLVTLKREGGYHTYMQAVSSLQTRGFPIPI